MKLIVFIPALNEEASIGKVIKSIPRKFQKVDKVEVVVVNDGSTDNTAQVARDAGAIVVTHSVNKGVGAAFHSGLNKALELNADMLVNIDADGQFSPNDIEKLITPIINDEADFVSADRFVDDDGNEVKPQDMSDIKYWGNKKMSQLISRISGSKFNDVSCGFRAYSKEAMLKLNLDGQFTYTQESFLDLTAKGMRVKSVPVVVKYFKDRKSRVAGSILKYAMRTSSIIFRTYRDYKPLKFFGLIGGFLILLGSVFGGFLLIHYFQNGAFTPYIFVGVISIYLITLGIITWIVGLMADMLDRVRTNQEKTLYYLKKQFYSKKSDDK